MRVRIDGGDKEGCGDNFKLELSYLGRCQDH